MKKTASAVIGACGEHYVAAYLSGLGLVVAMPRGGAKGFDLLVTNENAGHAIRVQVKTGTQSKRRTKGEGEIYLWRTSEAAIGRNDKYQWYAYVWLRGWPNGNILPEIFFVPSNVVVKCVKQCLRDKEDTWFWMYANDSSKYNSANKFGVQAGLQLLLGALKT